MVAEAAVAFTPSSAIAAGRSSGQELQVGFRSTLLGGGNGSSWKSCPCTSQPQDAQLRTQLRIRQLQHWPCGSSGRAGDPGGVVRCAAEDEQGSDVFGEAAGCRAQFTSGGFFGRSLCSSTEAGRRRVQRRRKGTDAAESSLTLHGSRRNVLVRCSSTSPTAVTEDNCETIDPGLLARVSKLYRPAVILPGLGNNTADYDVLVQSFEALEIPTTVVKVARVDWLRNAAGLLDINYWKGTLQPRPVLNWYLDKVKTAIETAKQSATGDGKVSLIGHSAGGWLARVYLKEFGTQDVALLVTLGTPHMPPPRGVRGVFDQTRGLLYHLEDNYPGAYHAPDVKYVCVSGRYMRGGGRLAEEQSTPVVATGAGTLGLENVLSDGEGEGAGESGESLAQNLAASQESNEAEKLVDAAVVTAATAETPTKAKGPTFRERIVGAGYKQVCGKADVWGDGVVPEESAHLEGALNISIEGVYHSPVGASDKDRPWYGSAGVIDQWVQHLLE